MEAMTLTKPTPPKPAAALPLKVAIYLRQSDDKDNDELGVDRQREACLAMCAQRGWTVVEEFMDNDTSASSGKPRPRFNTMMARVDAGDFDVIMARHMDRLLRRLAEFASALERCQKTGTAIVTVRDNVDTSTDGGRVVAGIMAVVAQGEVERKGARQKDAFIQRAQLGKGWGVRQFGYSADHNNPKKIAAEAKAIKRAYSDVIKGDSLYAIAKRWNDAELFTTKGNAWSGTTVGRLLKNPRNAGLRAYRGDIIGDGDWPAIVDRDTWDAVHYILSDPARRTDTSRARTHILGGILRCGACRNGLSTSKNERGQTTYRCKTVGCAKVVRQQVGLDEFVRGLIVDRILDHSNWEPDTEQAREAQADLLEEAKKLNTQIEALAKEFSPEVNGALDPVTAARILRMSTEKAQARLREIEDAMKRTTRVEILRPFIGVTEVAKIEKIYDDMTLEQKRTLIQALCGGIVIKPQGRGGWARGPVGTGFTVNWHKPSQG